MSHFIVLVLGDDIDEQLAPFDENSEVAPYLNSLEGDWKLALDRAREYYAAPPRVPDEVEQMFGSMFGPDPATEEKPDTTDWTSRRFLDEFYGPGYWKPSADGGFEHWSTYNPKSKWDWYVTGGRWEGFIQTKDGREVDEAKLKDVDIDKLAVPFAFVKDSQWYQRGEMGWWAVVSEEKKDETWEQEFRTALRGLDPETKITAVDCHI